MANKIQIKRSAVPGRVPTTGSLELGELALNTYDGKLYVKIDRSGTQSIVELGAVGYTGSQGYTGSVGYTGSTGYTGSLGFTG